MADGLQSIVARWKEIQAEFVDEPRTAAEEADALVAELKQRLAEMFARQRAELEQRWAGGNGVSTEELRQSLHRYHSFFKRLLARNQQPVATCANRAWAAGRPSGEPSGS